MLAICLVMAGVVLVVPAAPSLAATRFHLLLPDLRMQIPQDVNLDQGIGFRHLRFTAIIENLGRGPLDAKGARICPTCSRMRTRQRMLRSDGTWRVRQEDAKQRYATGDGHHHWHVIGMERYELYPMTGPFDSGEVVGAKTGYCFFDGIRADSTPPGARPYPYYSFFGCGDTDSQHTHVGLSVGWGDIYQYNFAGQYIDVTNVPTGDYLLCVGADPNNDFRETRDGNNQAWAKVTLAAGTGGSPDSWTVTVSAAAPGACAKQLPYAILAWDASPDSASMATARTAAADRRPAGFSPLSASRIGFRSRPIPL
jgi:Lysyl oxidase